MGNKTYIETLGEEVQVELELNFKLLVIFGWKSATAEAQWISNQK